MLYRLSRDRTDDEHPILESSPVDACRRAMKAAGSIPGELRVTCYGPRDELRRFVALLTSEPGREAERITVELIGPATRAGRDMADDAADQAGGDFEAEAARDVRRRYVAAR